jgi:hypothetical protein
VFYRIEPRTVRWCVVYGAAVGLRDISHRFGTVKSDVVHDERSPMGKRGHKFCERNGVEATFFDAMRNDPVPVNGQQQRHGLPTFWRSLWHSSPRQRPSALRSVTRNKACLIDRNSISVHAVVQSIQEGVGRVHDLVLRRARGHFVRQLCILHASIHRRCRDMEVVCGLKCPLNPGDCCERISCDKTRNQTTELRDLGVFPRFSWLIDNSFCTIKQ